MLVIIQWWVPPMAAERRSDGRRKLTTDLFGSWFPLATLTVSETPDYQMPPAAMSRSSILLGPVDLDDGRLPFQTSDALTEKGAVVTALTWTRTERGNVYRQYRLLTA